MADRRIDMRARTTWHRRFAFAAGIFALGLAAPAQAAVTFTEGTFAPGDVFSVVYNNAQPVSPRTGASAGQSAEGDPGPSYAVDYRYGPQPGGADLLATSLLRTFVYDPGTTKAIRTLDVSLDYYATLSQDGQAHDVGSYALRPLIAQDGLLYAASFTLVPADLGGVWRRLAVTGLTAADFGLFDRDHLGTPDYSRHPSFSDGEITFGFAQRADGGGDPILRSADGVLRADNFAVTVNPVPEPATWMLMIAGFGLLGMAMRNEHARAACSGV